MNKTIFSSIISLIFIIHKVSSDSPIPDESLKCSNQDENLSHSAAVSILARASIKLSSFGDCFDPNSSYCTSLENIKCTTICALIKYKTQSSCYVTITGGTEIGHNKEQCSHKNGFRLNIAAKPCHSDYIHANFHFLNKTQSGATQYQDSVGNIYRLEGNHWNILYLTC